MLLTHPRDKIVTHIKATPQCTFSIINIPSPVRIRIPTMEVDCAAHVCRCHQCQVHGDLKHMPPMPLHIMISPWPFSTWGIEIIGKIHPIASNGHEFILVAIDYFTKWVEAASYKVLNSKKTAQFFQTNIIYKYGIPHEIILDNGLHFKGETEKLLRQFNIRHHKSSPYRP